MAKKDRDTSKGTNVPKSRLAPAQVHQKVEEGVSNVIPMYCFHYGDPESKPPVESKVCHKISPETFCCTMWLAEPAVKCRLLGHDEDGQPQVVVGCALSPYVEFERLRESWLHKGRKMNPLKASRRAARGS